MQFYVGGRRSGKTLRQQAALAPEGGWAAQHLRLPVAWYDDVATGSGAEFPVSGDQTTRAAAPVRFARKLGLGLTPWQEHVLSQWIGDVTPRRDTPHPKDA